MDLMTGPDIAPAPLAVAKEVVMTDALSLMLQTRPHVLADNVVFESLSEAGSRRPYSRTRRSWEGKRLLAIRL